MLPLEKTSFTARAQKSHKLLHQKNRTLLTFYMLEIGKQWLAPRLPESPGSKPGKVVEQLSEDVGATQTPLAFNSKLK